MANRRNQIIMIGDKRQMKDETSQGQQQAMKYSHWSRKLREIDRALEPTKECGDENIPSEQEKSNLSMEQATSIQRIPQVRDNSTRTIPFLCQH